MNKKSAFFMLFSLLIAALTGLAPSITLAEEDMPWGQGVGACDDYMYQEDGAFDDDDTSEFGNDSDTRAAKA